MGAHQSGPQFSTSASGDDTTEAQLYGDIDAVVARVGGRLLGVPVHNPLFCGQLRARALVLSGVAEILGAMHAHLLQFEVGLAQQANSVDQRYLLHKTIQRIVDTVICNAGVVLLVTLGQWQGKNTQGSGGDDGGAGPALLVCALFDELVRASQTLPPDPMNGNTRTLPGPSVLARTAYMAVSHELSSFCAATGMRNQTDLAETELELIRLTRQRASKLRLKARKSFAKLTQRLQQGGTVEDSDRHRRDWDGDRDLSRYESFRRPMPVVARKRGRSLDRVASW